MEAIRGRIGGYDREQTRSSSSFYNISSSSGTLSTAYASSGSRLSSISMETALHLEEIEETALHLEELEKKDTEFVQPPGKKSRNETDKSPDETENEKKAKQIKSLVKEFFGAPSAKLSIAGVGMSVLERWLTELGVGWLVNLALADGASASAGKLEQTLDAHASSWIRALTEIKDTFCFMTSLFFPDCVSLEEEEEEEQVRFAIFTQQTMLKMLTFVDILRVAANPTCQVFSDNNPMFAPEPYQKIHILLGVRSAMFQALLRIQWSSSSRPSAEFRRIQEEIVRALSVKEGEARDAIWTEVEQVRTQILESLQDDGEDSPSSGTLQSLQGSSDIHKAAPSVLSYIRFLQANYWTLEPVVRKHVPQIGDLTTLDSMIIGMASCLEQKLANKSEAFPNQSLKFLFMLNNSSFMRDQFREDYNYIPKFYDAALTAKVEGYMDSYINSSWAPVLACLFKNPTPGCFGKNSSPLPKFESELHKTFITQKLWKVPDPWLRKQLRKAITDKIVPGYTKYIEDNNITTPRLTPQELEDMLQELFEG